jgi:hypothetical protein
MFFKKYFLILTLMILIKSNQSKGICINEINLNTSCDYTYSLDNDSNQIKRSQTYNNNNNKNVCINGIHCSSRKTIYMRSKTPILVLKHITCPCTGKFNYQCSSEYCGLNKISCDKLNTKSKSSFISKCANDYTIVFLN